MNKLDLIPYINDKLIYEVREDNQVFVLFNNDKKIQKYLRMIGFGIPEQTTLDMDEYSSFVFLLIDGKRSVKEIGELIDQKYGLDAHPIYERLEVFMKFLADERGWVLYK